LVTTPVILEFREGLTRHGRIVAEVEARNGEYEVSLPVGNYYVVARANGYHEKYVTMFNWHQDDGVVRSNISLSPVNLPREAFRIELTYNRPDVVTLQSHLWGPVPNDNRVHLSPFHNRFALAGGRTMAYLNDAGRSLNSDGGTIRINEFIDGRYDYYVHVFSSQGRRPHLLRSSNATVRVFNENNELLNIFHVPSSARDSSDVWHVFSIEVIGGRRTIVPVNTTHIGPTDTHHVGR
jgi:hypothetical protein